MNLPFPPTDSFYKFCAIAGTIIYLLVLYILWYMQQEMNDKMASATLSVETATVEKDFYIERTGTLDTLIKNAIAENQGHLPIDSSKLLLRYSEDEIKAMVREAQDLKKSTALKIAEAKFYTQRGKDLLDENKMILYLSIAFFFVGIVTASYGYLNWYRKVQVPIDKAIMNASILDEGNNRPITQSGKK